MDKILIIGQAPPMQKQELPYDTTMLYDWFDEIGINRSAALQIFDFESVSPSLRGLNKSGGHMIPLQGEMKTHYTNVLMQKIRDAKAVIILGNVALDFLSKERRLLNKPFISLMHPSKRNYYKFTLSKVKILDELKSFLSKQLNFFEKL